MQAERLVGEIASRIDTLGVEVADIAGNLDEVTTRFSEQAARFEELQGTVETMVSGNREIDRAARSTQSAANETGAEISESRTLIGDAVRHIADLTGAVGRIEERLGSFARGHPPDRRCIGHASKPSRSRRGCCSLNAAIEAARAGEAGKGFAVVAGRSEEISRTKRARPRIRSALIIKDLGAPDRRAHRRDAAKWWCMPATRAPAPTKVEGVVTKAQPGLRHDGPRDRRDRARAADNLN